MRLFFPALLFTAAVFVFSCKKENGSIHLQTKLIDSDSDGKNETEGVFAEVFSRKILLFSATDTNNDKKPDSFGYYISFPENSSPSRLAEEIDSNGDGRPDILNWYLPGGIIAQQKQDDNFDGFFETTRFYSNENIPLRMEIDSNKDGKADQIFWDFRMEADSDFNGVFESFAEGISRTELRKLIEDNSLKSNSLPYQKSWYHNPDLIPEQNRTILPPGFPHR